jgi:hypothetical protein
MAPAVFAQSPALVVLVPNWGPRKNASSGTSSPQAKTPPAKFSAPRVGPIMYPTPRYAGLMAGAENVVMAPACTVGEPAARVSLTMLFPSWPTFTRKSRLAANRLSAPRKNVTAPIPMLAKRILAALAPCWPAL